jgi:hypothetical protein
MTCLVLYAAFQIPNARLKWQCRHNKTLESYGSLLKEYAQSLLAMESEVVAGRDGRINSWMRVAHLKKNNGM